MIKEVKRWKQNFAFFLALCMIMILQGCGSIDLLETAADNKNPEQKTGNRNNASVKDVVFWNHYPGMERNTEYPRSNQSYASFQKEENEQVLYAYFVEIFYAGENVALLPDYPREADYESGGDFVRACWDYRTKKAVELMENAGFTVVSDAPFTRYGKGNDNTGLDCMIVGTWTEIENLLNGPPLDDWYIILTGAPRLDLKEALEVAGWKAESEESIFYMDYERTEPYLGSETQIVMKMEFE